MRAAKKKADHPHTYVFEPSVGAQREGRKAVLRVDATAPGNWAIARQLHRWLLGKDLFEEVHIELVLPDKEGGGIGIVTPSTHHHYHPGSVAVHVSVPHRGRAHYDVFDYTVYPVDAEGFRHHYPIPAEEEEELELDFVRLTNFPEGEEYERLSMSPPRSPPARHILDNDDDINIVIEEQRDDDVSYDVPLDVPPSKIDIERAREAFDESLGELRESLNDPRLSKKQREANNRGMKRVRTVYDRLLEREAEREERQADQWVRDTLRMMKESEEAGWYGQAERFLQRHGGGRSVLQQAAREEELEQRAREDLRRHHRAHKALEQRAREEQETRELLDRSRRKIQAQKEHEEALEFIRRTDRRSRAQQQQSPSGAFEAMDAQIGAHLSGGNVEGDTLGAAHMLRIGTLLLDCVTLAADTRDADMIAKLGTLTQICGHCDHVGGCHHRCKRCNRTAYCDADCARADWTKHQRECGRRK